MIEYIERKKILDFCNRVTNRGIDGDNDIVKAFKAFSEYVRAITPADVQPVVHCKDCQWLADVKVIEAGELYHICGMLGFDTPDGFACNQGKRKGQTNGTDKGRSICCC